MVTLLATIASIAKPELSNRKMWLLSEETAVLSPHAIIRITIAFISGVCTWFVHPACAPATFRCPAPVVHLSRITWHQPPMHIVKQEGIYTLILDKLFTVWGDCGEARQLRQTRSHVVNVTWVTPLGFISFYQCSVFTVVTDDCHANSVLISHIAESYKWLQTSLAIRIYDIIALLCCRIEFL